MGCPARPGRKRRSGPKRVDLLEEHVGPFYIMATQKVSLSESFRISMSRSFGQLRASFYGQPKQSKKSGHF